MGKRRRKFKLDMASRILKPILKVSTHIFTVSGVLVAGSPLINGLTVAAKGQPYEGARNIVGTTTGLDVSNIAGSKVDFGRVVGTGVVIAVGIGLIAAGAYLRKRIGRSH